MEVKELISTKDLLNTEFYPVCVLNDFNIFTYQNKIVYLYLSI